MALIPGVSFRFANGEEYVVPPLTLGALEFHRDRIKGFQGDISQESINIVVDVTLSALKRNYPEMTVEKVKNDLLDLGNMLDVFGAVMDVGGMKRKAQELEAGESRPEQKES